MKSKRRNGSVVNSSSKIRIKRLVSRSPICLPANLPLRLRGDSLPQLATEIASLTGGEAGGTLLTVRYILKVLRTRPETPLTFISSSILLKGPFLSLRAKEKFNQSSKSLNEWYFMKRIWNYLINIPVLHNVGCQFLIHATNVHQIKDGRSIDVNGSEGRPMEAAATLGLLWPLWPSWFTAWKRIYALCSGWWTTGTPKSWNKLPLPNIHLIRIYEGKIISNSSLGQNTHTLNKSMLGFIGLTLMTASSRWCHTWRTGGGRHPHQTRGRGLPHVEILQSLFGIRLCFWPHISSLQEGSLILLQRQCLYSVSFSEIKIGKAEQRKILRT